MTSGQNKDMREQERHPDPEDQAPESGNLNAGEDNLPNESTKDSLDALATGNPAEQSGEDVAKGGSDPAPDELGGEVKALQDELAGTKDQLLRALAEVENTRRRSERERDDTRKYANTAFARDLLDVADNLRRAIDSFPEDAAEDVKVGNFLEGIKATERDLLKSFEKNGIAKLEPKGEQFDPNFHEVMFEAPGSGQPAGTIIEIVETGYTLNGRILRPARVGVAKAEENSGPDQGQNNAPGSSIDTEA